MANQTFKKSLLALAVGGICSSAAMAEDYTTGNLNAKIQDTAGNPIANAAVTVRSNKGVNRSATTDSEGNIRIPQLPIGAYSVTVTGQGYNELVAENIQVKIGAAGAFTFTMESEDSAIEEIYVTGVRQGSWDFDTTTTGITVDVGEVFSRAPLGRSATSVVLLAPGTSEGESGFATGQYGATGTMASFAGSSIGENVYYINGMNITNFRNFIGGSTIPFELFDQIEVKTGGYQAEFGRSTGGVTNAVTKSGSNEFEFGVNAYFSPDSLTEDRATTYTSANQFDERDNTDINVWGSGAIVQDKLFFFALYNARNISQFDCGAGGCEEQTQTDPFYAAKIDFVPVDGHRLELTYFSDDTTRDIKKWRYNATGTAASGDVDTLSMVALSDLKSERISDSVYVNGGQNSIIRYTAALTDWMTISAMYGRNEYARENYSNSDAPFLQDYRTGTPVYGVVGTNGTARDIGTWSVGQFETGEDIRDNYRVDADFYFEALGDHHVRVGWDKEELESNVDNIYSGDCWCRLYYSGTSPTGQRWRVRHYYNDGGYTTDNGAMYIQDSWQITDNLTLNIGLRDETFENFNVEGDSYLKSENQLAPRLGFSWDPTGDGKNRIYASWGEYYLPIATNTNIRLAGKEIYTQQYFQTTDVNQDGQPDYDANGQPILGPNTTGVTFFADGSLPFAEAAHAEVLDPLYQSEYIIGFEHTFSDEWTVGIRYIKRDLTSLIEDVAIDAGVIAWAEANGFEDDPALASYTGFHQYALVNPGKDFRIATVEDFGADGVIDWIDITGDMLPYPEGDRTYEAVDLTVEREWDEKWYLSMGYTWSESLGNYEGVVKSENNQDDAGLTQDFDQPGLVDGAYGPTPNDREHRFKGRVSYALSEQFMVAAAVYVESPRQMGCIGDHPTDYFAYLYGAASWYCGGELTPRGSQMETDWRNQIDASFIWTPDFSLPGDGELVLRMDVFNMLDSDGITDRWEFGDIANSSDLAAGGTTQAEPDPNYGNPTNYQTPRSVRFGFSYNF